MAIALLATTEFLGVAESETSAALDWIADSGRYNVDNYVDA
jgi:hypothetical protein